jgi:hypothetical protein
VRTQRQAVNPVSKGRVDRRSVEARALRNALLGVALFAGIVLFNAIVAVLFIALLQSLGLWTSAPSEAGLTSVDLADEGRIRLQSFMGRPASAAS